MPRKEIRAAPSYLVDGHVKVSSSIRLIQKEIPEPNRSYLIKYIDYMELNGRKERTQAKRINELRAVCKLNVCKDFKKITKDEVEEIVRHINKLKAQSNTRKETDRDLTAYSKGRIKLTFKQFIKYISGSDGLVGWIKMGRATNSKLPTELLTEDEVSSLIDSCLNPRDRALIALLWDSGARIGEILNLKVKDVVLSRNAPGYIVLDGKTGVRRTPLSVSVPYIVRYLNEWRKGAGKEDSLFVTIHNSRPTANAMDYPNVKKLFVDLRARAKLDKRLHPHLFRYSRCTFLSAKGMPAEAMKLFFGWSGLKMISHYSKLSGAQVDAAFFKAIGMQEKGEPDRLKLAIKRCFKCREDNEATATHCIRCMASLDPADQVDVNQKLQERVEKLETALIKLSQHVDPKTKKDIGI